MSEQTDFTDPFAIAKEKRDSQKKEQENSKKGGNFNSEFPDVKYTGLEKDQFKAFRIIGVPAESRRNNYDPKIIMVSQIVNDKRDNFVDIVWPWVEKNGKYVPDPNWILTRLYDKVNESKWVKYTEADVGTKDHNQDLVIKSDEGKFINERTKYDGRYVPFHQDTSIYKRINKENIIVKKGKNIQSRFYPSIRVIMNVLDRMDNWCKENKKYKVLTNKVTTSEFTDQDGKEQIRYYADNGISKTLYDKILQHFLQFRGDWFIDVAISKVKNNNFYDWIILDATDTKKLPDYIKNVMSEEDLTQEEKNYESNNLDEIFFFNPTSALRIRKHIGDLFEMCDRDLNTSFKKELEALCDAELEKFNQEQEKNSSVVEENSNDSVIEETEVPEENVQVESEPEPEEVETHVEETVSEERPQRQERHVETPSIDFSSLPHWNDIENADRQDIIKFAEGFENGEIVYKSNSPLIPCDNCKKDLPNTVYACPYCGTKF